MMLALSDYIVYHRKKDVKGRWRVLTMEKKNLSQQTMERLYNTIVAEKRMQPGDKPVSYTHLDVYKRQR